MQALVGVRPADDRVAGPFKALLYDSHWRDVIALSMSAAELSLHGVLAHGTLRETEQASAHTAPGGGCTNGWHAWKSARVFMPIDSIDQSRSFTHTHARTHTHDGIRQSTLCARALPTWHAFSKT